MQHAFNRCQGEGRQAINQHEPDSSCCTLMPLPQRL